LHYETASTTQQPRGEHRGTVKDCKIAGATTWQRQSNHTWCRVENNCPPLDPMHRPCGGGLPQSTGGVLHCLH